MLFFGQIWPIFENFWKKGSAIFAKNLTIRPKHQSFLRKFVADFSQKPLGPNWSPNFFWYTKKFSAFYDFLGAGHSKIALFLAYFAPTSQNSFFSTKFQLKIYQRVFAVQKRSRYVKSFKIDRLSKNVSQKGYSHLKNNQNHKWQNSNSRGLGIFGFYHLWFWVCCGCQKLFLATFSEHWSILEDFPYLDSFCTGKLAEIFWVKIWQKNALLA